MTQLADRPAGHEETPTAAVQNVALGAQSLTMVQALNRALRDAMAADDRVLVFGEDVAVEGGVFRVTEGLAAAFGENRCFDTPLAESAIIGIAVFVTITEVNAIKASDQNHAMYEKVLERAAAAQPLGGQPFELKAPQNMQDVTELSTSLLSVFSQAFK